MGDERRKLLVIGAHPDDCEIKAGGLATRYAERGDSVKFVSLTNGATGHHEIGGVELARRRAEEARAAADVIDAEYAIWDTHTGELVPSLENRKALVRTIREYDPDLVLTHRSNDYHPDHRYAGTLVRDAAYLIEVPNMCPLTPALENTPVIAHFSDEFEKPNPFEADVAISIDETIETKIDMIHRHESQLYEWLPYNRGTLDEVPDDSEGRREWLKEQRLPDFERVAERSRDRLVEYYGAAGDRVQYAEAFEISEYGGSIDDDAVDDLFPH
ncbi:PIG-L family deacetylase [Halomontanus rarus]|uniref:PIG-L family deacetylase n=1 Tax=Halomontanus rarus TaxID=3034020 RepID=UPI001A98FEDB